MYVILAEYEQQRMEYYASTLSDEDYIEDIKIAISDEYPFVDMEVSTSEVSDIYFIKDSSALFAADAFASDGEIAYTYN